MEFALAARRRHSLAVAFLTVAIALQTSTVTGMPGFPVSKVPQSGLNFGGGMMGFGQQIGQTANRVVERVSDTLTLPFKQTAEGEKKPNDKRLQTASGLDAVTSGPRPVVPQRTSLPMHHTEPAPSGNQLETTTESRNFVGAPLTDCEEGQVKNMDRECVDTRAAPED